MSSDLMDHSQAWLATDEQLSNVEIEQALLAALLHAPETYDALDPRLTPEHFAAELHQALFSVILARLQQGAPISVEVVKKDLPHLVASSELIVAKNRQGMLGTVTLTFDPVRQLFVGSGTKGRGA
ncbi:MAG: DnaB-like helicase N-terminal domain-containing protein [Pseudomonadota bacterium]